MFKTIKPVLIGALIILVSTQLWARPSLFGKQGGKGSHARKNMVKELQLTKDQIEKSEAYRLEHQKAKIRLDALIKEKHLDLRAELRKDNPDRGRINRLINDIGQAKTDLLRNRIEKMLQLKSILTPEQKEKLLTHGMFAERMRDSKKKGFWKRGRMGRRGNEDYPSREHHQPMMEE